MSNLAKYLMAAAGNSSAEEPAIYKDVADYSHVRFDRMNLTGTQRPFGVFIHPEGTKFYLISDNLGGVKEMNLSTPYDISTRSSFTASLSLNSGNSLPRGLFFKPNGLKLWIADVDDFLYEYTLTTAWDISTASFTRSKDLTAPFNQFFSVFFKPDGTKLWGADPNLNRARGFDLTTAWDITTISPSSYDQSAKQGSSSGLVTSRTRGIWWSDDGTKAYMIDAIKDYIGMWNAATPWDTTAITADAGDPDSSLDISSIENNVLSMCFSKDGKYIYIGGLEGDGVDQFVRT